MHQAETIRNNIPADDAGFIPDSSKASDLGNIFENEVFDIIKSIN